MKSEFITLSFGVGALLLAATHAFGQTNPNCGPRDRVIERLASVYGESRRSIGLAANNRVLEVYASDETGTWTVTVTLPDGMTCLVASGNAYEGFENLPPVQGTAL
ncbi:MAG: hypothetical protein AAFR34_00810 [Pseudomonadota bacterium]